MAIPGLPQGLPQGMPQVPPGVMTAGAPPQAAPQQNPMALLQQLAQRGQGGLPPEMQMLLMFLAGMGYDTFASATAKLRGKEGGARAPAGAPQNPAANPMMAKLMAMRAAGGTPSQT